MNKMNKKKIFNKIKFFKGWEIIQIVKKNKEKHLNYNN
jgi:hypothetical protein